MGKLTRLLLAAVLFVAGCGARGCSDGRWCMNYCQQQLGAGVVVTIDTEGVAHGDGQFVCKCDVLVPLPAGKLPAESPAQK